MRKRLQKWQDLRVHEPPLRPRLAETLVAGLPVKLASWMPGVYTPRRLRAMSSADNWAKIAGALSRW